MSEHGTGYLQVALESGVPRRVILLDPLGRTQRFARMAQVLVGHQMVSSAVGECFLREAATSIGDSVLLASLVDGIGFVDPEAGHLRLGSLRGLHVVRSARCMVDDPALELFVAPSGRQSAVFELATCADRSGTMLGMQLLYAANARIPRPMATRAVELGVRVAPSGAYDASRVSEVEVLGACSSRSPQPVPPSPSGEPRPSA